MPRRKSDEMLDRLEGMLLMMLQEIKNIRQRDAKDRLYD